jgi:precorrin-6Y C5,15-methyltransferase (decarboxylating)
VPPPLTIIGTGVSPDDLTACQRSAIEAADLLVGGRRLLDRFAELDCQRRVIDRDLEGLGDLLESRLTDHTVVVLTSGDPLFFGIGAFLVRRLGIDRVRILPNVSAVAAAFARLGKPWQGVRVVSLHGRRHTGQLLRCLAGGDTVAVYTDPAHHPAWLADRLLDNSLGDVSMCVMEELGRPGERITRMTPEKARTQTFADLNLVVLEPDPRRRTTAGLYPGMPDNRFVHENGLITKSEVRAVSLARLRLFDRAILWDLGAGSGSVSIESGRFITRGEIYALEKRADRIAHIQANRSRFGIGNLHIVQATLPAGLADLPDPDRVFIGGGGRHLADIIGEAAERLKPDGTMVVNTVLLHNLSVATQSLQALGWEVDTVQIQVSRATPMPFSQRLEAANPVWIVTGTKPQPIIRKRLT